MPLTGTVLEPLPSEAPNGVTITLTSRGSPGGIPVSSKELQWLGAVQEAGLSVPRMRWLSPAGTWFLAAPVWTATQRHGCALPQSVPALPGQAVPVFLAYSGEQPFASSSLRLDVAGSQSSDCVWLPETTRRLTIGSLSLEEIWSPKFDLTPIFTTRLWLPPCWSELGQGVPFSESCASLIGPERSSLAEKWRWTTPKLPVQPCPLVQSVLPTLPLVSFQSS